MKVTKTESDLEITVTHDEGRKLAAVLDVAARRSLGDPALGKELSALIKGALKGDQ